MARSPKPAPLWVPIVAAVCFALAALLQEDTFGRVAFGIAAVALGLTALVQWRMRRSGRERA
ncbi:hypothetical protein [Agrococcus carbonis]|uniref:MYXO-CTERM domain-containing protein n=1 Tax=Agrococcus carbonis TaxID=684552 RepID=A0A1H1T6S9_9MICO|nr:hypothetical protein [Agrococcus carbonis]SDS55666.1 hypothetical protein SAMN04489719_2588 [Agrococcus carbonis]